MGDPYTKTGFVRVCLRAAREAAERRGVEPWAVKWAVALACHESGWGRYIPAGSHNPIGYHWEPNHGWDFVEATEGGTGKQRRYRKFGSLQEAFEALFYLWKSSSWYAAVRVIYGAELLAAHRNRALNFSKVYCPADANHGPAVVKIWKEVETITHEDRNGADFIADADGRVHEARGDSA